MHFLIGYDKMIKSYKGDVFSMNRSKLAQLIFPEISDTIATLEQRYPPRPLPIGAEVTRFAPSPTGFLHTGSLFTAMIAQKVARDSHGVFFVRLEDTDTKREIAGSGNELLSQLAAFDVVPNEGYLGDCEQGAYGPYCQSDRAYIYKTVIKAMIERDLAYPCFCGPDELEAMRKEQEKDKVIPGYYGSYAKCRFLSEEEVQANIISGKPFVIRFKSPGNHLNKIAVNDLIRGQLELTENDQDIIILKGDGLPTYHFAHVVDDHFMHTTIVSRGEEWLPSLPIHLQMFECLGWAAPKFAHLPVINKLDEGNKRKLSKRKDPEAAVSFFLKDGYPPIALLTYLMSIANSNFEEWWALNKTAPLQDFAFSFSKMSLDGALFDLAKVQFFAKEILSLKKAEEIAFDAKRYAETYDADLDAFINRDYLYFVAIMNIEREKENPRKDYAKYSDIWPAIRFFDESYYRLMLRKGFVFNPVFSNEIIIEVLSSIAATTDLSKDEQTWFSDLKTLAEAHRFAPNNKLFKQSPTLYVGHVGDVAEMLRIALTGSKQSPNLYYVMKILGDDRIRDRIGKVIEKLR